MITDLKSFIESLYLILNKSTQKITNTAIACGLFYHDLQLDNIKNPDWKHQFYDNFSKQIKRNNALNSEWLLNFLRNCYNNPWNTNNPDDYDYADLEILATNMLKTAKEDCDSDYAGKSQRNMNILSSLKDIYYEINPYPWLDIDQILNSANTESDLELESPKHSFHYLLFSAVFLSSPCLKFIKPHKHASNKSPYDAINQDILKHFSISNQLILYGYPESGKSYFAKKHIEIPSVIYYDLSKEENTREGLLSALRPDYYFWTQGHATYVKKELPSARSEAIINPYASKYLTSYEDLLSGKINYTLISNKKANRMAINFKDIIIILDHVKDSETIKEFEGLMCKTIFITDFSVYDSLPDNCKTNSIFFDNHDILKYYLTEQNQLNLDSEGFFKLYSKLGSNFYIYRLIMANYKKCEEEYTGKGKEFLNQIMNFDDIDHPESLNSHRHEIQMRYKSGSTKRNYNNYIQHIYSNYLDQNSRWFLRLLCRIQKAFHEKNINLTTIIPYLGEYAVQLKQSLLSLGWLKQESLNIPEVIMSAFNYKPNFSNQEYDFLLNLMTEYSLSISGCRNIVIDKNVCHLISKCLFLDYKNYMANRKKQPEKKLYNDYYKKIDDLKTDNSDFDVFQCEPVNKRLSGNSDYSEFQYMSHLVNIAFFASNLFFSYQYNIPSLWNEFYAYLRDYEWKVTPKKERAPFLDLFLNTWSCIHDNKTLSSDVHDMCTLSYYVRQPDFPSKLRNPLLQEDITPFNFKTLYMKTNLICALVRNCQKYEDNKLTYTLALHYYIDLMSNCTLFLIQSMSSSNTYLEALQILFTVYEKAYNAASILREFEHDGKSAYRLQELIIDKIYLTILSLTNSEFGIRFGEIYQQQKGKRSLLLFDQHFLVLLSVAIFTKQYLSDLPFSSDELKEEFIDRYNKIGDLPSGINDIVEITLSFISGHSLQF